MKINAAGVSLIKSFEHCRLKAFLPTPNDVPTIGWGRTKGVRLGDTCTQEEADAWLLDDLEEAEECVNRNVEVVLTDNEYSALVSLVYNIGCGAFKGSTLLKLVNESHFDAASLQFRRWDKQKGRVLAGLTRRRLAEERLFETA